MPRSEGATPPSCCATLCHAETEISPLTKPASFLATAEKKRERCLATIPLGSRGGSEDTTLENGSANLSLQPPATSSYYGCIKFKVNDHSLPRNDEEFLLLIRGPPDKTSAFSNLAPRPVSISALSSLPYFTTLYVF